MPDQEPPEENVNLLTRARDRLIERHQCTEEEADAMLRNTLQILLEEPNPPPEPPQEPPKPPATPPLDVPRPPNKKKATYVDFDQNYEGILWTKFTTYSKLQNFDQWGRVKRSEGEWR